MAKKAAAKKPNRAARLADAVATTEVADELIQDDFTPVAPPRPRRRRPRPLFEGRGIVRDYLLEAVAEMGSSATPEAVMSTVRDRIKTDFASSPFLAILLALLEQFGPILLEWLLDLLDD